MKIIFDLAGTVLGSLDMSLRPGIRETIEALRSGGNRVDFWTSGPVESYSCLLRKAGITGDVYSKGAPLPYTPDIYVDDDPWDWGGRVFKAKPHIAEDFPCDAIRAAELLSACSKNN